MIANTLPEPEHVTALRNQLRRFVAERSPRSLPSSGQPRPNGKVGTVVSETGPCCATPSVSASQASVIPTPDGRSIRTPSGSTGRAPRRSHSRQVKVCAVAACRSSTTHATPDAPIDTVRRIRDTSNAG